MNQYKYFYTQSSKTSLLNNFNNKRHYSIEKNSNKIKLFNEYYPTDDWTNITKNIEDKLNRNLLHHNYHPLWHLTNKIKHFFYKTYVNRSGTPLFSIYDNFKPIVTVDQNFDRYA